jgi:uncharacterized protein
MSNVTVLKLDLDGKETWRYSGQVLERSSQQILLEAFFNRPDTPFHGILLRQGDRFIETFFSDRWYNIFELRDKDDDHLKGWYCNIGCPADIQEEVVSYVDLALDLLVYPDGRQLVLDEDEFEALSLEPEVRQKARQGLHELQALFSSKKLGAGDLKSDQ